MTKPRNRFWMQFAWGLLVLVGQLQAEAAVTPEQRAKLNALSEAVLEAGEMFQDQAYLDCAEQIREVQLELVDLLKANDAALNRMAKPLYMRLEYAHGQLELQGAELEPLPSWSDIIRGKLVDAGQPETDQVSFARDIAPWFISACGNCHMDAQRGQFSMTSYATLMRGARNARVVYGGDAKGSPLVEVIQSGDMPRGNGPKVSPEQLDALKRWIDAGAEFDGPQPTTALTAFAGSSSAATTSGNSMRSVVQAATGDETVSFAKDIAPILAENCNGCHINGRRPSGSLRMDTFEAMLRGGDSGELIAGTNANDSLLIQKLRGQVGQRMPAGGRPPLSDEQISLISTWIREGATFDGPAADAPIEVVINQAWAAEATHAELFQRRQTRSLAKWRRVLPNEEPATSAGDEVFVLGNIPPTRLESIADQATEAIAQVKRLLKAPMREPLVKGGISIFVLKSRYDYSEFGRMTENRELPKNWLGHWQADPLDVYAVLSADAELEDDQAESIMLQVIAGAYLGSFREAPAWFAEGVARNLVFNSFRRGDERVKQWQAEYPSALQKVDNPKTLLEDRLDEEAAGLIGMSITNFMMDRGNRRRFDKLLSLMREGRGFDEATTFAFAPPEALVKTWLGKPNTKR